MNTERLSQYLKTIINEYAFKNGCTTYSEYSETVDRYNLELENIRLEFLYSKRERELYPISTLYCRVHLDKNDSFFFEIPDIIYYTDVLDFHCYYFAFIESKKRMSACFNYIMDFFKIREGEINALLPRYKELKLLKAEEIKRVYLFDKKAVPEDEEKKDNFFETFADYVSSFTASRFTTSKAYSAYLRGDFEKAVREYKKYDELLDCEKRLIEFIDGKSEPYQAVDLDCASVLEVEENTSGSIETFFLTIFVSCLAFYLAFLIIQLIVNAHYHASSVFANTVNPFFAALIGILPGLALSLGFRSRIEPLFKKNKVKAYNFMNLRPVPDKKEKRKNPIKIALIGIILFSVIIFSYYGQPSLVLYKDRVEYNSHAHLLNPTAVYDIDDFIDVVIVKGYYYDNLNKYSLNQHYVLRFTGKRYIDVNKLSLSDSKEKEFIEKIRGPRESDMLEFTSVEDIVY